MNKQNIKFQVESLMRFISRDATGDNTSEDACCAENSLFLILREYGDEGFVTNYQNSEDAGPSLCKICGPIKEAA